VDVRERGYGAALYYGSQAAQGEWIIMGDSDDSYDFSALDLFVAKLREGCDLVMGNRFSGGIAPGAMPWKNRYVGNPILSWIGRVLFKCPVSDFHCGLRAYTKAALQRMDLRTSGMEFASEMVIKASLMGMRVCEVPTTLSKDGRSRPPHLRPWRDGWLHLRFMLLFNPRWLFMMPGTFLALVSLAVWLMLLPGPLRVGRVVFDIHTLLFAEAGIILGGLFLAMGFAVRLFGAREGLLPGHPLLDRLRNSAVLEIGSTMGLIGMLLGLVTGAMAFSKWATTGFGAVVPGDVIRQVSISTLFFMLGGLVMSTSLLLGFLALPMRRTEP
jgi:hypothetical protein